MLIATYRLVRVKEKTKVYIDKAKNTKQSDIQVGNQVLVKDKMTNSPHHSIQCNPTWLEDWQQCHYRNSKWDPKRKKCFPCREIWDR